MGCLPFGSACKHRASEGRRALGTRSFSGFPYLPPAADGGVPPGREQDGTAESNRQEDNIGASSLHFAGNAYDRLAPALKSASMDGSPPGVSGGASGSVPLAGRDSTSDGEALVAFIRRGKCRSPDATHVPASNASPTSRACASTRSPANRDTDRHQVMVFIASLRAFVPAVFGLCRKQIPFLAKGALHEERAPGTCELINIVCVLSTTTRTMP